jgi:hypothetical protein
LKKNSRIGGQSKEITEEIMAQKDTASKTLRSSQKDRNAAIPAVGAPLDGRHYLDVTEEQQYAGKPFAPHQQDIALKEGGKEDESRKG